MLEFIMFFLNLCYQIIFNIYFLSILFDINNIILFVRFSNGIFSLVFICISLFYCFGYCYLVIVIIRYLFMFNSYFFMNYLSL